MTGEDMLLAICHSAARMLKSNGGSRDDGFACLCSKISNFVASLTAETFYQTGQKVIILQPCRSLPLTAIDKCLWETRPIQLLAMDIWLCSFAEQWRPGWAAMQQSVQPCEIAV